MITDKEKTNGYIDKIQVIDIIEDVVKEVKHVGASNVESAPSNYVHKRPLSTIHGKYSLLYFTK